MYNKTFKSLLAATVASTVMIGAAHAGGFARGDADTDIIYEDGNFNMRSSVTFVSPKREFSKHSNPDLVGTNYADNYVVPSFAIKANISDNLRCAGTHVMNNGGSAVYAAPTDSGKIREDFNTYESGVTCGVKFDLAKGSFWALGGGYAEQFDYTRVNVTPDLPVGGNLIPLSNAVLSLKGQEFGYRAGLAYEIKEIAFRAQLMYRSGTQYGADGNLTLPSAALLGAQAQRLGAAAQDAFANGNPQLGQQLLAQAQQTLAAAADAANRDDRTPLPAIGTGKLPQSVEFNLQSGIAPGWLAFGSLKWTDWSATTQLIANAPDIGLTDTNDYFWRDGWTVSGGVGHAFNDKVSGLVGLTWDRGVSTGYDHSFDTWTVSLGASYKDQLGGELRGGVGYTFIEGGCETKYGALNSCVKDGYALAGNIGYAIKW